MNIELRMTSGENYIVSDQPVESVEEWVEKNIKSKWTTVNGVCINTDKIECIQWIV